MFNGLLYFSALQLDMSQCQQCIALSPCIVLTRIENSCILIGLLGTVKMRELSFDMTQCHSTPGLIYRTASISIELNCPLITIGCNFKLIILALHICQQITAIASPLEIVEQPEAYFRVGK